VAADVSSSRASRGSHFSYKSGSDNDIDAFGKAQPFRNQVRIVARKRRRLANNYCHECSLLDDASRTWCRLIENKKVAAMNIKDRFLLLAKNAGSTSNEDAFKLRERGDRLRDAGEFAQAAEAYAAYLAVRPDDFGLWVQRGNCLKDSGERSAAEIAYESAVRLNPDDPDVHLQLGHLMKLQGRKNDALRYYKKSHDLNPKGLQAVIELRSLGLKIRAVESPLNTTTLESISATILDISDLLAFLQSHNRVTGIQRVQSCIVHELLQKEIKEGVTPKSVFIGYCDQDEQTFYIVSDDSISQLINLVQSRDTPHSEVRSALDNVYASRARVHPRKNDVYILLGAFWIGEDYSGSLLQLKSTGTRIGVYIYDLIPLTHPQFVTAETRESVLYKLAEILSIVDFVLTISEYVAKEVKSVMKSELDRNISVVSVPLAHELPPSASFDDSIDDNFYDALPAEYVLCVGTLEGRKNNLLLLNIWSQLKRKYNDKIPHLVLVGKWGWKNEEFREQLAARRNVDGKVIVIGNVSDAQLQYLYQQCLLTIFPSFVEGWGLPIGESLAYGKPCIASNTSSIPEVGGKFCRYINPYDVIGATEAVEKAIFDRKDLESWTKDVAANFKVRTWAEVASDFMRAVREAVAQCTPLEGALVQLHAGEIYNLTFDAIYGSGNGSWRDRLVKFVCMTGWRPLEKSGAWAFRRIAKIEFGADCPAHTDIRVLLMVRLPAGAKGETLTLQGKDRSTSVFFSDDQPRWIQFSTKTEEAGMVRIQIERIGQINQLKSADESFFGISAIAFHPKNDLATRLDVLEALLLFNPLPPSATASDPAIGIGGTKLALPVATSPFEGGAGLNRESENEA
jgi:glycosyltransferase involved in cell wall biosynthesis